MKRRIALAIAVGFLTFSVVACVAALVLIVQACFLVSGLWSALATGLLTGLAVIGLTQWVCNALFKPKQ